MKINTERLVGISNGRSSQQGDPIRDQAGFFYLINSEGHKKTHVNSRHTLQILQMEESYGSVTKRNDISIEQVPS